MIAGVQVDLSGSSLIEDKLITASTRQRQINEAVGNGVPIRRDDVDG